MATVVVVGGGFAGTLTAIHLLQASRAEVVLVERGPAFARGIAYSTRRPEHRLNVRAANMSALPDEPGHFAAWLAARDGGGPADYVPRGLYGDYLSDLLDRAEAVRPGRLRRVKGDVADVARVGAGFRVALAGGPAIAADAVVLALGNLPPGHPPGFPASDLPPDTYVADPWAVEVAAGLGPADEVAVIGTGLTMVDVVVGLGAAGFAGRVTALSRRGLLPRPHRAVASPPAGPDPLLPPSGDRLAPLVRATRRRADAIGWREAVDALRPLTQSLWRDTAPGARARFLRHLRPWWDVHRHRLAPSVAARLAAALADGRLVVEAGRLLAPRPAGDGVELRWRARADDTVRQHRFRRVVNCTGPSTDLACTTEPLLRRLAAAGMVRADNLRLGVDVGAGGEAVDGFGRPDPRLYVVGPMSRGAFWEIVAVPDIRVQVRDVAARIAAAMAAT